MARALARGSGIAEIIRPILDHIAFRCGREAIALYELSESGGSRRVAAVGSLAAGEGQVPVALFPLLHQVLKTGQPRSLESSVLEEELRGTPYQLLRSATLLPISVTDDLGAVLALGDPIRSEAEDEGRDLVTELSCEVGTLALVLVHQAHAQPLHRGVEAEPDPTERMLALTTLRDMIPQVVLVKDLENRVLWANRRAEEFYHLRREQMEGEFLWEIDPLNAAQSYRADLAVLESGEAQSGSLECITGMQGEEVWLRVDRAPVFGDGGRIVAVVTAAEEVSDQLRSAEALRQREEDASRAERRRDQYLLALASEVREPLVQAQRRLAQLRSSEEDSALAQALDAILEIQQQSLSNIQDLLDFSRVENGNLAIQTYDFDLEEIVWDVLSACERSARRRGIELASRVAPECPTRVAGDASRVRQILIQIVGCALRVARGGEVFLLCSPLGEDRTAPLLRFEVRAPSSNLNLQELEEYFAAYRSDVAAGEAVDSTHELRLALARTLTRLLGGEVDVEIAADRSFVCRCQIPLRRPIDLGVVGASALPRAGARVLLCEPNANMRAIHDQRLRDLQMVVDTASQPRVGAEMVRAAFQSGWPYDVVICERSDEGQDSQLATAVDEVGRGTMVWMMDGRPSREEIESGEVLRLPWRQNDLRELLCRSCGAQSGEVDLRSGHEGERSFLVVDDDPVRAQVTAFALRRIGGSVWVASKQEEALDQIERRDFDLVIVDEDWLARGHESIVDDLRRLEGSQRRTRIAVGVHEVDPARVEELAARGFDGLIGKPLDVDALFRILACGGMVTL